MRALILAAGEGTRLRPLTREVPKCLVPLAGRTLLDRQMLALRAGGIQTIGIVGGYRADQIKAAAPDTHFFINDAFATTNMVASLFSAREWLADDSDLIVVYGDIVFEPRVLATLLATSAQLAVVVDDGWKSYWESRMADPLADAETLRIVGNRIVDIGEKASDYTRIDSQYIGLLKFDRAAMSRILRVYDGLDRSLAYRGRPFERMYMTDFIQQLIDAGVEVRPARITHGWLEVDTIRDHEQYERMRREGTLDRFCRLD